MHHEYARVTLAPAVQEHRVLPRNSNRNLRQQAAAAAASAAASGAASPRRHQQQHQQQQPSASYSSAYSSSSSPTISPRLGPSRSPSRSPSRTPSSTSAASSISVNASPPKRARSPPAAAPAGHRVTGAPANGTPLAAVALFLAVPVAVLAAAACAYTTFTATSTSTAAAAPTLPIPALPTVDRRLAALALAALGAAVVSSACLARTVLYQSVTPLPGLGIQLTTARGLRGVRLRIPLPIPNGSSSASCITLHCGPIVLSTSRAFVPLADIETVVVHEGLTRWSVRYYLGIVRTRGRPVVVAYDSVRPRLDVLVHVYHAIREALWDEFDDGCVTEAEGEGE